MGFPVKADVERVDKNWEKPIEPLTEMMLGNRTKKADRAIIFEQCEEPVMLAGPKSFFVVRFLKTVCGD